MEIVPIADFRSPLTSKFGIPRQSGVVPELKGTIVFRPEFRNADALRGMDGYDYLWLIWGFSAAVRKGGDKGSWQPTVRPPRLGGNVSMGVFATRSPFRPNGLGLSSVKISRIEHGTREGTVIQVLGADLMDGTPIYDIKPYVEYADSHQGVRSGFTDTVAWKPLEVVFPEELRAKAAAIGGEACIGTICSLLAQDPRPQYRQDGLRIYGMPFGEMDIKFSVEDNMLTVKDITI